MTKTTINVSFFLLITTFFSLFSAVSSDTSSFVYGGCTQLKYDGGSSYDSNVNSVLASLVNSASISLYNNFTIPNPTVYGLFQCRGDISTADCATCVRNAVSQLPHYCFQSCGGTLQLDGCHVRYGNDSFLAVPDTTLVFKKCGTGSSGYQTDMLSRRDEVLSGLNSGSGSYRVGSIGYVSGMSQCVGDLSGQQCTDCVGQAVERLRGGCGAGAWGNVYLAKCYVRYSAAGVYLSNSVSGAHFWVLWKGLWGLVAGAGLFNLLRCP